MFFINIVGTAGHNIFDNRGHKNTAKMLLEIDDPPPYFKEDDGLLE